jgi:fatty-acyl-CoA synthase
VSFPTAPESLPDLLERAARSFPDRGVHVMDGRGRSATRRSFAEVLEAARVSSRRWHGLGLQPGDPVLVALPTSWDWFDAWLGAALLGALPAALSPPAGLGGGDAYKSKLLGLRERLGTRWAVVPAALRGELGDAEGILDPGVLADAQETSFDARPPHDIAFLQFTSGSTGWPRAVMIPQSAAVHNPRAIDEAVGASRGAPGHEWAESVVSWLPLFHDMGLVGCFLFALYSGLDFWVMPPTAFLARPHLWLERLGAAGTTLSPAPNFGYQYCVERVGADVRAQVDLSGWAAAMTGAEMIRPETTGAFEEMFGPSGFAPEAFRPCYGLAEGTLAVTFDQAGRGVRTDRHAGEAREFVSVGTPLSDTEVSIAGPDGQPRADGDIGSILVRGPGVFAGYYNNAAATADTLRDGWLHTGDLGYLRAGELHITGRTKDLLIIRGNNLMPHEIEWVAEAVTGGGGACRAAAFSVDQGASGEAAVLVVEVDERDPAARAELEHAIKQRVGRSLGLTLADVRFVRRGRIPRTTSGKVRRHELFDRYVSGELETL